MPEASVPNRTLLDQIRRRVAEDGRLGESDALTLLAELDRLTAERDEAWTEVMDRRTQLHTLHHYVSELKRAAANHPSAVMRLNDEVDAWATRCGAAEAERDEAEVQRDQWRMKYETSVDQRAALTSPAAPYPPTPAGRPGSPAELEGAR
jgi:hypothetical protein